MTLLCLLLLLSSTIHGHPTPDVPVPDGPQAGDGHCDTLRALHLSLQAAVAETGDTCQGVQASGEGNYHVFSSNPISYCILHREVPH